MYYLVFGLLYLVSLLPFRVLYLLSDFAYVLIHYVIKYRRAVVLSNLKIAFPEKTDEERMKIAKEFYRNFTDNFIETIKLLSISEKELNKRFIADHKDMDEVHAAGYKSQVHLGHFFNWEYANVAHGLHCDVPFLVVYMPIKSPVMERLFVYLRTRFGSKLIAATHYRKDFAPYSKDQYCLVLVGDQNPGSPDNAYWLPFFGKMTPFVKGPEKGARLNKTAVLMSNIYKVKRGYYKSEFRLLTTDPRSLPDGEITRQMAQFIENAIRKNPSNYLWSHRRWKWQFDEIKHSKNVV